MTLFFVLSGFVIHYGYHAPLAADWGSAAPRFLWARFARLFPLLFLVLMAERLFWWGGFVQPDKPATEVIEAMPYFLTFTQSWIYDVIGANSLIYQLGRSASVSWSISVEFFFYLLYAAGLGRLMGHISSRAGLLLAATIPFAVLCLFFRWVYLNEAAIDAWAVAHFGPVAGLEHGVQDSFVRWILYFCPLTRLPEFMCGSVAAQYFLLREKTPADERSGRGQLLAAAAVAAAIGTHLWLYLDVAGWIAWVASPLYALPVAWLIYTAVSRPSWLGWFLSLSWMRKGGEASYSIYLGHPIVLYLLDAVAKYGAFTTLAQRGWLILFGVAGCLAAARISYRIIEVPAQRWLKGFYPARTGPTQQWR
jgi:peptidoglycan/LPS O-acetylase OafA/YrhL